MGSKLLRSAPAATPAGGDVLPKQGPTLPATIAARLRDEDLFLTRAEAGQFLRRSVPTMERWAREGIGPRFMVIGGRALYSLAEVRRAAGVGDGA